MRSSSLILVLLVLRFCVAQQPTDELIWQLEESQSQPGAAPNPEAIAEMLASSELRIKVNFANADEWARLHQLDIFQISNLLQYREQTGTIYSIYELMTVKGFNRSLLEAIAPFLDFSTQPKYPRMSWSELKRSRHEIILRYTQQLQSREGFRMSGDKAYLGPAFGSYLRYRGSFGRHMDLGLAAQNDAGEPWGGSNQPLLFDHTSAFLSLKNIGPLEKVVLGDFQVSWGQGLALWSGGGISGAGRFASIKRYGRGINPYAGALETRFFRGLGFRLRLSDDLGVEAFLSGNKIDGRVEKNKSSETVTLVETGLHRNLGEVKTRNTNKLTAAGARLNWRKRRWKISMMMLNYRFKLPVAPAGNLYNRYRFSGKLLSSYALTVNYLWRKFNLFAEYALDDKEQLATVNGVEALLADGLKLGLGLRSFNLRYQSLYSSPPARRGTSGERGIYLGLDWELYQYCRLQISLDHYQYPWISYRADAPYQGRAATLNLHFPLKRNFSIKLQLRHRKDRQNKEIIAGLNRLTERTQSNLRLDWRYQFNSGLWLAWRVEKSCVDGDGIEQGFLIYQDVGFKSMDSKWELRARLAFTDVTDYAARLYAYEYDLLYRFSIPAYYGRSSRCYLLLGWQLTPSIKAQARMDLTSFNDRSEISSGLQKIVGNQASNLAIQLRIKI